MWDGVIKEESLTYPTEMATTAGDVGDDETACLCTKERVMPSPLGCEFIYKQRIDYRRLPPCLQRRARSGSAAAVKATLHLT